MNRISINGLKKFAELERKISLHNGSLVFLKKDEKIVQVYEVVSFRDNQNRYNGDNTTMYCTLLDLDTGMFAFEERCSRNTTVRRVLNHLLRLGNSDYKHNESIPERMYNGYDVDVIRSYKLDITI